MDLKGIIAKTGKRCKLKQFNPKFTGAFKGRETAKQDATQALEHSRQRLAKYQDLLYAQNDYAVLVVFQAMDAAGKDGTIKHVMSGVNPTGCQVFSFKAPSAEERDHDYLWRHFKSLPERGRIGIFNRSYYEDVLITRVHPEIIQMSQLPQPLKGDKKLFDKRYKQINNFEKYLHDNGIIVIKFFLNVSKDEQRKRFLERIDDPTKNWKFSENDAKERNYWDKYQQAFEECFTATSTDYAPWYIIPADNKWFTRVTVAEIIADRMKALRLKYPQLGPEQMAGLQRAKFFLVNEGGKPLKPATPKKETKKKATAPSASKAAAKPAAAKQPAKVPVAAKPAIPKVATPVATAKPAPSPPAPTGATTNGENQS
jgi:PPK2 family polyphosphate:nucleotide phosphotransferase